MIESIEKGYIESKYQPEQGCRETCDLADHSRADIQDEDAYDEDAIIDHVVGVVERDQISILDVAVAQLENVVLNDDGIEACKYYDDYALQLVL